jgi:hypothetical protein
MLKYSFSTSKTTSKLLAVAFLSVGITSVIALPANAADVMYHGNFCSPNRDFVNSIERNQWGVMNTSTSSSATVNCPFYLPFNASLIVNSVYVTVYDRNPSTDVSCTLMGVGLEGSTIWSITKSSSGSGATHQLLGFSPPSSFIATMNMSCSIPASTSSGFSHVTTYRVITTP